MCILDRTGGMVSVMVSMMVSQVWGMCLAVFIVGRSVALGYGAAGLVMLGVRVRVN